MRPAIVSAMLGSCVAYLLMVGCGSRPDGTYLSPEELGAAALKTHINYIKARNTGETTAAPEIPAAYWTKGIRSLHPIKVYTHRANIVVVQRISDGTETGTYISILISSYAPRSGDDGFAFTHTAGPVYDFTRHVGN